MSGTPGQLVYQLAFQISPIVMTGGLANNIPGGMLPILALTQPLQFVSGLLSGASTLGLDDMFAQFHPMAGATLQDVEIGKYPFANQAVAGNALISNPLTLSMLMICPARDFAGYLTKLATMMALKASIDQHTALGGTYTVLTPSYFYSNGVLRALRDVTGGETKQAQSAWQWDFEFPLLTLNQAQSAQNSLMSKLTNGTQLQSDPSWTGIDPTAGDPGSLASSGLLPVSANTPASSIIGANVPPAPGAVTDSGYNTASPFGNTFL